MFRKTFVIILIVGIIGIACILYLSTQQATKTQHTISETMTHEERLAEVKRIVAKIKPGMTRSQVEEWFKERDGGFQISSITRYYEHPEVMIEVPYDQTGGNWSKDNRVNGPIKVYRNVMTMD